MSQGRFVVLLLLAFGLAAPGSVAADSGGRSYVNFGVQCTPGAFRACASVRAWTGRNALGGTSLFVRIANVQGRPGFEDLPASALSAFTVGGLSFTGCVDGLPYGCGAHDGLRARLEEFSGPAIHEPIIFTPDGPPRRLDYDLQDAIIRETGNGLLEVGYSYADDGEPVWGCDFPDGVDGNSMCEGWGTFEFNFGPFTHLTPVYSHPTSVSLWFGDGRFPGWDYGCSTEGEGGDRCVSVPEPNTWVLLTTGIALLGLAGWRRRAEEGLTQFGGRGCPRA